MSSRIVARVFDRYSAIQMGLPGVGEDTEVGTSDEDAEAEEVDLEAQGLKIIQEQMQAVGKKPYYWIPKYNFMLNQAIFAWNGWYFTILPMFWKRSGYRDGTGRMPQGIVLHPIWQSFKDADWRSMNPKLAYAIIDVAKKMKTIKDQVKGDLRKLETHFNIEIPSSIESKLLADCEKVAVRRMGVDRLRVKDELWPFDGGKPIKLGAFD